MKLFGFLVAGLVLLLPAPARAQSVHLADLVGTWAGKWEGPGARNDTLFIRADSTYRWAQIRMKFTHWHRLSGDTLSFQGDPGYHIILKEQLTLTNVRLKSDIGTFKRLDAAEPKP